MDGILRQSEIQQIITECQRKLGVQVPVKIEYKNRFTARMGDAIYFSKLGYGQVRFSVPLFRRATREEQINTVVHEFCHIAKEYLGYKDGSHGGWWQYLHRKCGYEPHITHNIDRTGLRRTRPRIKIVCSCCKHVYEVTSTVINRAKKGYRYSCRLCRTPLKM